MSPADQPHSAAPAHLDDVELVQRVRAGDQAAWSFLIREHQDRLFNVCLRMVSSRELAADCTQDAFVKIIQGMHTFDGRSKLSTWMIRITMNVCLSKLRSEKLRRHASLDATTRTNDDHDETTFAQQLQSSEPQAHQRVEDARDRALLQRALTELDPEQRAILILADARGVPYEQIAQVLGIAIGTVKSRVFRARTALRDCLEALRRTS
jgi:RNA polymerase sigma-70 factor (ECF subfamily)